MDYTGKRAVLAGAGVMGASLALVYAKAGFSVTLYDLFEDELARGRGRLAASLQTLLAEGMLSPDEAEAILGRIDYTSDKACFQSAFLILENITENLSAKQSFWKEASALAPSGALLATDTSGLSIGEIAEAITGPERFAGQHWLNPPHLIPLCEVVKGEKTAPETMAAMVDIVTFLGKKPVVLERDIPGFITNRLQFALLREALHIVESGAASVEDVDNTVKYGLGVRYACLGPFDTADLAGLDNFDKVSTRLFGQLSAAKGPDPLLHGLVEQGSLGVKSRKGFYDYSDGKDSAAIRRRDERIIRLAKCLFS